MQLSHLSTPNGPGFLGKHVFDPFLTRFSVPKRPIFNAFGGLEGAKMAQNGFKMGPLHLFVHPKGPIMTFGKRHF